MKTFVFQGDSITDADRGREEGSLNFGHGYPALVSAKLGYKYPGEFKFINSGISGDKSANMYARIKRDTLDYEPDYLSILIGVNDVWHALDSANPATGYSVERYTQILSMFIEDVLEVNPNTVIAILEPFVLDASATHNKYDGFRKGVDERAVAAKAVAEKYNLIFVPLQDKFNEKLALAPESFWLVDGVHPTQAGHELISNELIKALGL